MTRKYIRLTRAQCIEAAELIGKGGTAAKVAERYGVHRETLQRSLTREGLHQKCPNPQAEQQMGAEEVRAALALYLSGVSVWSISKTIGRHRETVAKALRKCPEYVPPVKTKKAPKFSGRTAPSQWDQDLSTRMLMTMRLAA